MIKEEKNLYLKIGIGAILALIVGVSIVLAANYEDTQKAEAGELKIEQPTYDFGNIPITGGKVKHEYLLKNESDAPISLKGLKTSCMCTTAIIKFSDGTTSPKFGMHNNPAFYSKELSPGDSAKVIATFDPMFHGPSGTGHISRIISILSNKEIYNLKFTANVTP